MDIEVESLFVEIFFEFLNGSWVIDDDGLWDLLAIDLL